MQQTETTTGIAMRWRILAVLFLARIGLGFQFQTLPSVGESLGGAFGLDYTQIGVLIGLFMAPGLVLALPAGFWGRYISDRLMVSGGLGALALGGLLSSLAQGAWMVGLGQLFCGAGFLFSTLYFAKMVADWFEGREIATAMSILVMSWPFGIAMGQVGHAWLAELFGWRLPFRVAAVYCLLAAGAVLLVYRPPQGLARAGGGAAAGRLLASEWRLIVCAGLAWGAFNAGYVTYLSFGPRMLEGLGLGAIAAAGTVSLGSWLMIFSGALCGQIVDRFGRRELVLAVCMGAAVLALVLLRVPGSGVWASLLFGLLGMAPAGVIMALSGAAMRPQVRAFGMGVFFTVYYAVMLLTPPVAGALQDATGGPWAPLVLAIGMFLAVVPLALGFRAIKARG